MVPIDEEIRRGMSDPLAYSKVAFRRSAVRNAASFNLRNAGESARLIAWWSSHLVPAALRPPKLSTILDLRVLAGSDDLEQFAGSLADVVVGPEGAESTSGTLVDSVRLEASTLEELSAEARRALTIYTMSAHGGMSLQDAERHLSQHLFGEISEFLSASIHSLIGRLFSVKTIEDCFCLGVDPPLVPAVRWVFHSTRFDTSSDQDLTGQFFSALAGLGDTDNPAVRDLAATGRFYDWLAPQIDPTGFRRLLELFFSHSFRVLDGDLLGRFFEMYAQRVDSRRRRELGQYYTPAPIVRFMWKLALQVVHEKDAASQLVVLDPSVGSGTFLIEGARQLHAAGISRFWDRLSGFDIAPQVIGIAQVNLYLAVLGLLDRVQAEDVGNLQLYPTDALDPRDGAHLRSLLPLLTEESVRSFLLRRIDMSERVKQRARFPLVIGNPPYKHNSGRTLGQMAEQFPPLLRLSRVNARPQENPIRDDYVWFFGAGDHYLNGQGVIAFVVSDSFCYGPSFRYFREDLLLRYRIRHLVHLGRFIFRDVGPRTSFVIIIIERRATALANAEDSEPVPYIDLRALADGHDRILGTQTDPRFVALEAAVLEEPIEHRATRSRNFRLFPAGEAVALVMRAAMPLIDSPRRVFVKKWPGVVSGFDKLFKSRDRAVLERRMRALFETSAMQGARLHEGLDLLAADIGASAEERGKLGVLAGQISNQGLRYEQSRIRRGLTGTAPRTVAWYPDRRMTAWLYYEPRFIFERAVHEGKAVGWGTSNQWREPATHTIAPKFVFTTSTNPEAGLKAFVLTDDWIVLKAAGTRQQLNYTGIYNPLRGDELTDAGNVGGDALPFFHELKRRGHNAEGMLLYLAAIYNSALAGEYLEQGGENAMHIPLSVQHSDAELVDMVISSSRRMRDFTRLGVEAERAESVSEELAFSLASEEVIRACGFERMPGSGGRFRHNPSWRPGSDTLDMILTFRNEIQAKLDDGVRMLFERLP